MEKWKAIPETQGYYEVSNHGRVRSWHNNTNTPGRRDKPIIMSQNYSGNYPLIVFRINKVKRTFIVHRLVAEAFIPNPENKPEVNHIDSDKTNNCASNLEWVTRQENRQHSYRTGNETMAGEDHTQNKLTEEEVLEIRAAHNLGCFYHYELAEAYGVQRPCITDIVNRKSWTHI